MRQFVAAALIVIASVGAANALPLDDEADAGSRAGVNGRAGAGCSPWICGSNGTQLTGIQGAGNRSNALAAAVTLPSGEIVRLGANEHHFDDEDGVGAGCSPWVCGSNGTQLTGIQIDGNRSSTLAAAVTLPSGEIVRLGANERPFDDEVYFGGMCPPWMCNGTQLTGIQIDSNRSNALAAAVTLPSGETVRLGANERRFDGEVYFGAGSCLPWSCNGTQLTGIQIDGNRSSALAAAVTLPSGETVRLGDKAAEQPRLQVADRKGIRDKVRTYDTIVRDGQVTQDEYRQLYRMSPGATRRR